MNANSIFKGTKKILRDHGADIFSVLSGIGVIATGVTAFNAGRNTISQKNESDQQSSRRYLLKPVLFGAGTIGCIYGARHYGKLKEESLLAACSTLALYARRKEQIVNSEAAEDIHALSIDTGTSIEDTGTGEIIFIETFTDRRFKASIEVVEYALSKLQETFSICGYVSLNDFYSLLGIEETASGEILGWTADQMVLDPDYKPGNFFEYREALTELAIHLSKVDDNTYELHYNILPVGSLAGIGPCNY